MRFGWFSALDAIESPRDENEKVRGFKVQGCSGIWGFKVQGCSGISTKVQGLEFWIKSLPGTQ